MLGLPDVQAVAGVSTSEFFAPQSREKGIELIRLRQFEPSVPMEFETVLMRRDGSQFPAHVIVSAVQLPDGLANMSFAIDTTEPRRLV